MEIIAIVKLLYSHMWLSDIAITLYGLILFSSILQKFTTKGPMVWPLFGIVPSIILSFNSIYDWTTKSLINSGGTFYFRGVVLSGTHGIITAKPSIVEYMLKTNFKNFPKGKNYRERFFDLLGDGIFNADGELWKQQRRAATFEMYSNQFVEYSLNSIRDLVHKKLLKVMESVAESSSCIDLQEVLLHFTFDNICNTAFGIDPGCLEPELPDVPFAKAFEEATQSCLFRFLIPPFVWKPMKFFGLGFEKRLKEAVRVVHHFAESTVRERKMEILNNPNEFKDRSDLLTRLIKIEQTNQENGLKGNFNDSLLGDFCISFILAGRDTSSVGLAWFFWLIHKNPSVETKILDEIKRIIAKRKSKEEMSQIVFSEDELKEMVYLQAALSESLRLYPPVPIDFKEVLEDDLFPDGTTIKGGDRVLYSIYSMARLESIWGKDCNEFKPERWIKDGEFVSENQFKYAVFNGGPRLCVGKKFAYLQMKMVSASILLRYSVKVVEGHRVYPKMTTTLYMKNGLMVNLEPRVVNRF